MSNIKALSIKQPWASLIAHGIKDIENRTWRTNFRGRIYIHASGIKFKDFDSYVSDEMFSNMHKKISALGLKNINERQAEFLDRQPKSAIIGEVDIVDCVLNHQSIWAEETFIPIEGEGYPQKPIWNWVLANPVLYDKPILNVKGKLSFWEYTP